LDVVHNVLLKKADEVLYHHLKQLSIPAQTYGIRWIRLLFGREFPLPNVLEVWDALFADGPSLVDYMCVSMLIHIREVLIEGDYATCMHHLMHFPTVYEVNYLIQRSLHLRNPSQHPSPRVWSHRHHHQQHNSPSLPAHPSHLSAPTTQLQKPSRPKQAGAMAKQALTSAGKQLIWRREGGGEGKNEEEGWDEDEWEDFNISGEQKPATSSHEPGIGMGLDKGGTGEWEDEGWGTFEPLEEVKDTPSSGADFFDTLGQSKKTGQEEDLFERLGVGVARSGGVKKTSPPPVSSSLFGGAGKGEEGDWGDWGSDLSTQKPERQQQAKTKQGGGLKLGQKQATRVTAGSSTATTAPQEHPSSSSSAGATSTGWDFGSDWSSFDSPSSSSSQTQQQSSERASRQEELQRKREERRQRQQEAREKRAAGVGRRPAGLGAVKKD
jgi:hypothetical protein